MAEACRFAQDAPETECAGDQADRAQAGDHPAAGSGNGDGPEPMVTGDKAQPVTDTPVGGAVESTVPHRGKGAQCSCHSLGFAGIGDGDLHWGRAVGHRDGSMWPGNCVSRLSVGAGEPDDGDGTVGLPLVPGVAWLRLRDSLPRLCACLSVELGGGHV